MEFLTNPEYKAFVAIGIFVLFLLVQKFVLMFVEFLFIKFSNSDRKIFIQDLFDSIKVPLNFLFSFLGLVMALRIWGGMSKDTISFVTPIMKSVYLFAIFWIIYDSAVPVKKIFSKVTSKFGKQLSEDIANFIVKTIKFFILAIGFIAIMHIWGYNISGFLASLGLIGMALALAAKDTAANLFGSLVIFSDRPFKIGDWIMIPNVEGTVEEIGIRSTRIRTFAQAVITVPNATLANSEILNWTKMGKRRVKMIIGLTYDTNSEQLSGILDELRYMLKSHKDVHQEVIHIYFTDYNDSSLGIFCYYFTKSTAWGEHMRVKEDVNFKIMEIIERNGASFAFPTQSLHIESPNTKQML